MFLLAGRQELNGSMVTQDVAVKIFTKQEYSDDCLLEQSYTVMNFKAWGMIYLHNCQPPIIHRNLKSSNLLVDKNWTLKVGDFGLSRIKHETYLKTNTMVLQCSFSVIAIY
ncbi:putative protein kinase TKL-CTR1-DRK-2 family [Helianthus annuus]|uniref:Protein kinase domain-containing protein n=1 Tax=Helianthus annuus TaxID=4232 RepID=A0A9K3P6B1_HELAN|nr:putative protein kinase TKL-CTR1-DRK-2 family [Helianthus annuus]KAJ0959039.1 putative protein kinase TKL-CTR1-DRK-2 family [Helianthus annuus]